MLGNAVGTNVGVRVGRAEKVGFGDGAALGEAEEGSNVGVDGDNVGPVGKRVTNTVGLRVGNADGVDVGVAVGVNVG